MAHDVIIDQRNHRLQRRVIDAEGFVLSLQDRAVKNGEPKISLKFGGWTGVSLGEPMQECAAVIAWPDGRLYADAGEIFAFHSPSSSGAAFGLPDEGYKLFDKGCPEYHNSEAGAAYLRRIRERYIDGEPDTRLINERAQVTRALRLSNVSWKGTQLRCVPECERDRELCVAAISQSDSALRYVPTELRAECREIIRGRVRSPRKSELEPGDNVETMTTMVR